MPPKLFDQNVDAAFLLGNRVDHVDDALFVIGLKVDGLDVQASGVEVCGLFVAHFQVAAGHVYSGAGLSEGLHAGIADTSGGRGDDGDFSVKLTHVFSSFLKIYNVFAGLAPVGCDNHNKRKTVFQQKIEAWWSAVKRLSESAGVSTNQI